MIRNLSLGLYFLCCSCNGAITGQFVEGMFDTYKEKSLATYVEDIETERDYGSCFLTIRPASKEKKVLNVFLLLPWAYRQGEKYYFLGATKYFSDIEPDNKYPLPCGRFVYKFKVPGSGNETEVFRVLDLDEFDNPSVI